MGFNDTFDFYSPVNLKSYNLDEAMRYQLKVLDNLDNFTRKHSENVANLTCRICEYLRCKKLITIHATTCAYLHDIGKIFIPRKILDKPTALTDEEYEIMKKHTTLGYEMCMKDLKLRPYAEGALYHHEALNGTGYPNGVKKNDIPFAAQVIRVADEYDAIVTKRQYKTHINISKTLETMIKDAQPQEMIKSVALDQLSTNSRDGKISPRILKALFKVVIDDTLYEISSLFEYLDYLKEEIKRLETIMSYREKMLKSHSQRQKDYYAEGMKMLFRAGEDFDNIADIYDEHLEALKSRKERIKLLYKEIKIIKHLRV